MKTPTWGYVVGILLMLFGGCGGMKNMQDISMPTLLEQQKEMLKAMSEDEQLTKKDTLAADEADSNKRTVNKLRPPLLNKNIANTMGNMFNMSDYDKKWIVRFGYIGTIPTFIYILAGVFLLIRKKFSIKLAYGALVLSILFAITRMVVLRQANTSGRLVSMMVGGPQLFGIIIDIILIVIIVASDKSAYLPENLGNNPATSPHQPSTQ